MYRTITLICALLFLSVAPAGATTETLISTSTGWTWSGTPLTACKAVGVSLQLTGAIAGVNTTKYGTTAVWAGQMSNRLKVMGMNTSTDGEDQQYAANWSSGMLPYYLYDQPDIHAWANNPTSYTFAGNVKDVFNSVGQSWSNNICGTFGGALGPNTTGHTTDYWDSGGCATPTSNCENAQSFFTSCLNDTNQFRCTELNTYTSAPVVYDPDEADNLYEFNNVDHLDAGYILLTQAPSVTNNSGSEGPPTAHTYTDKTFYGKLRARDLLLDEYECTGNGTTHSGTAAACCTGPGVGTCSPDPTGGPASFGATYIGATPAADGVVQLNAAWALTNSTPCTTTPTTMCNTGYTTFNTTSGGGLSDLASGSYTTGCSGANCHGRGTGFLDENGKRTGPTSGNCSNVQTGTSWGNNATIVSDSHLIVADQVKRYVSVLETALATVTHPPMFIEVYSPPTYVLTAMAAAEAASGDTNAGIWLNAQHVVTGETYNLTTFMAYWDTIIAAVEAGSPRPIIAADFWTGNSTAGSDSPLAASSFDGINLGFTVQATRGTDWVQYYQTLLAKTYSNGVKHPIVGIDKLYLYDNPGQVLAFGIATPSDNWYDGAASSTVSNATAKTSCATSHVYTAPAQCDDGTYLEDFIPTGANGTTCTTTGSLPSWGNPYTTWGTDSGGGSCKWLRGDNQTYTKLTESASYAQASPGGGFIRPVTDWLSQGIPCDPAAGATSGAGTLPYGNLW